MKRTWLVGVMLLAGSGCSPSPPMVNVAVGPSLTLSVEVAQDEVELRNGLEGRRELSSDGMVFPFEDRGLQEVWMAGVEIPLDVAWIVDREVVAVRTLDPCRVADQEQCPRWESPGVVDALLEVAAGELSAVQVGMTVRVSSIGVDSDG